MSIATHIIDITGGTVHTVDSLLAAAVPSGASVVSILNAQLGSTVWQGGGSGTPAWGAIVGTLADQTDLNAALAGKAASSHNHTLEDITDIVVTVDTITFTQGVRPGLYDDLGTPPLGTIFRGSNDGHLYFCHDDGSVHLLCDSGGYGGTVNWGDILGTLADQTDLQTALDEKQPLNNNLTALAALDSYADTIGYFSGSGTASLTTLTNFGRVLISALNHSTARLILGAQAQSTNLDAIAGLTSAADKGVYFTGSGTAGLFTLTNAGRALLDDANAAAQRTTLGLSIGTNIQAQNVILQNIANLVSGPVYNGQMIWFNGVGTSFADVELVDSTPLGRSFLETSTTVAARTLLETGDGIRAWPGAYYNAMDLAVFSSTITMTLDRLHLIPFRFDAAETWDEIYHYVGGTGAGSVRLGLYTSDHAPSPTFTRVLDAGTVSVSTTGLKAITGLNTQIVANKIVYLGLLPQVTYTSNGGNVASVLSQKLIRGTTAYNGGFIVGFYKAASYGSGLPATVSGVSLLGSLGVPIVGMRTV